MKRIIRLTESDLARIVRRVINEGRRGEGKTIFILEEDGDMRIGGYFTKVENLVKKNIRSGKWKMRLINGTVALDFYVNGTEVFSDDAVGPESDLSSIFGNKIEGDFKITYKTTVHRESGVTYNYDYEIHIM